ncbi:MAG: type II secretion system protein GspD, partial [Deltaproteobacteria bacterium]|nr:type II secretion system protein GspD [Deltaproteobacteria bacterium]
MTTTRLSRPRGGSLASRGRALRSFALTALSLLGLCVTPSAPSSARSAGAPAVGVAYGQEKPAVDLGALPLLPRALPQIGPALKSRLVDQASAQERAEALKRLRERRGASAPGKATARPATAEEVGALGAPKGGAGQGAGKGAGQGAGQGADKGAGQGAGQGAEGDERWRAGAKAPTAEEEKLSEDYVKNCGAVQPRANARFRLDIYDEELESVVKLIACIKMRNIILANPLKGKKITIYSPVPVSADEAYKAFLTALEANGLTISQQGKFWRIIEIKDYARSSDPFQDPSEKPPVEDRMVTQIVQLKYVDAQEINDIITKLASPNAQIIIYQPNNSMIITELASNLRKLLALIKDLDVPGGEEQLWTYQVLHAEAADIAQKIQEVFEVDDKAGGRATQPSTARPVPPKPVKGVTPPKAQGAADTSSVGESELDARVSKVIADERTNRLLIKSNARSYAKVKTLIAKLDIPVEGDGQVHIHQLNHAKAADLSSVLSGLSQEQKSRGGNASGRAKPGGAAAAGRAKPAVGGAAGSNSAALFEGDVSVTADEDTNSLVITASFKDYLALKKVIDILDRPRRQVFIEALVMEVSIRNQRDFGLSLHGAAQGTVSGESVPLIFSNQPGSTKSFDLSSAATLTGLAVATQGPASGVEIAGVDLPSFGAILRALSKSDDVNIMSTPHILTTDNEEAEIVVGSNVPFVSGFAGGMGGLGGLAGMAGRAGGAGALGGLGGLGGFFPTVNVQRQDVALTLKITPRINAANFVTLEIDQVIEEIESIDPQVGPTTSKRSIKSTVVVKDQNTVVIGGLQKTRQINNNSTIPWLGEIPVIGYFFRNTKGDRERRNLLLLLTPHVIEGPDDFRAIFRRKLEEHREFVARFQKDGGDIKMGLDYGKKHGLLEAIHQSIRAAEQERALLDELKRQEQRPPLPQDVDGVEVLGASVKPAVPDPAEEPAPEPAPAPAEEPAPEPAPAPEPEPAPAP